MKKHLRFLSALLAVVVGTTLLTGCGDDKDEPVSSGELPVKARTFIGQYYPTARIVSTTKDKDDYEVTLSEGTRIDFDKAGEWTDVDAVTGMTVPSGFYPAPIDNYVSTTYPGSGINEISRETYGYEIELLTGTELKFNSEGAFSGYDR